MIQIALLPVFYIARALLKANVTADHYATLTTSAYLHPGQYGWQAILPGNLKIELFKPPKKRNKDIAAGLYHCIFSLRTDRQGRLQHQANFNDCQLLRFKPTQRHQQPRWRALGHVLHADRADFKVVMRIYPNEHGTTHVMAACTDQKSLDKIVDAQYVAMSGILANGVLVTTQVKRVQSEIPEHWREWKRTWKSKQNKKRK
jgi:hypothetical protein